MDVFYDGLTILISSAAFGLSLLAFLYAKSVASTELFISLRSRYLQIHKSLPSEVREADWVPNKDSDEWKAIEQYWYVSFDEWFSTTKIGGRINAKLWKNFYSHALRHSLKIKGMKVVLLSMVNGSVSFGSFRDEFVKELTILWKECYPHLDTLEQDP